MKDICYTKASKLFFTKDLIPDDYLVVLESARIYKMIKRKKNKILALKAKVHAMQTAFKQRISKKLTSEIQMETLKRIINVITPSFDTSLAFFAPCSWQDEFEILLFHHDFFFSDTVQRIIETFSSTSPNEFVSQIVQLVEKIGAKIDRSDTYGLSILIGLCFRAFFDAVYPEVKLYFVNELQFDLITALKHVTVGDIDPPRSCCPPNTRSDQLVSEVFRNDPNYSLAVEQVEFISFFTNPLDILHHVYHALVEIEKATAIYANGEKNVLTFDVTFGLFLCVLLSSNIPELMRIAMFADQYSPSHGLCPDFEFALAKLSTASIHLQNRAQSQMEK